MKVLLDTCTFLWATSTFEKLSKYAQNLFADPDNEIYLSVVSSWEIAIKFASGRLQLEEPPTKFMPARRERYGIDTLPLEEEAALYVARLPKLHADPFDRMLICQSIVHGLAILTPDESISQYPVRTLW